MFIGPVLMGIIGDWFSLDQGFIVLGVLGVLSALLSHWFVRSAPPKHQVKPSSSTAAL
ncbi:hypothetical protein [Paenibacillus sp. V4I5]